MSSDRDRELQIARDDESARVACYLATFLCGVDVFCCCGEGEGE